MSEQKYLERAPLMLDDITAALFWSKVDKRGPDECWPWTGATSGAGYGRTNLGGKPTNASRVALALRLGRDLTSAELACHHCDNPPCCNPSHLFAGSYADNVRDMVEKGRACKWNGARRGEGNPFAKLTEAKVRAIRAASGIQVDLAKRFGISRTVISHVRSRKAWAHVE